MNTGAILLTLSKSLFTVCSDSPKVSHDIWFYTFSTTAQTLAALVGLFAVFVVYKIQIITAAIEENGRYLHNIIIVIRQSDDLLNDLDGWTVEEKASFLEKHLSEREGEVASAMVTYSNTGADLLHWENYKKYRDEKRSILCALSIVFFVAFLAIIYAIGCLSFACAANYSSDLVYFNFLFVVCVLCLVGYFTYSINSK